MNDSKAHITEEFFKLVEVAEPSNKYAVAVRCSCSSVWCPKCFKKYHSYKQSARMQRMDWRRVRMITLTLNPAGFEDGEAAYVWHVVNKPIGRFIQNLGRNGIKVTDWTCNMEWHDNGFPHWHLLIEVEKCGRAGMIGQELLHKLWSWGDMNHRIHETFFKTEKQFKKFFGYFAKTGYLHKDKQHQIILPSWASGKGWAGMKINRFSSKRFASGLSKEDPEETSHLKRPRRHMTYAVKHGRCGQQVEIWEVEVISDGVEKEFIRQKIGTYYVPYDTVISHFEGGFYEGFGFSFEGSTSFVCSVLQAWEKTAPPPLDHPKNFTPFLEAYQIDVMRNRHLAIENMKKDFTMSLYGH